MEMECRWTYSQEAHESLLRLIAKTDLVPPARESTAVYQFLLSGASARQTRLDQPEPIQIRTTDSTIQYAQNQKRAWIRSADFVGQSLQPADIRDLGFSANGFKYPDCLAKWTFDAESESRGEDTIVRLRAHPLGLDREAVPEIEFSSRFGFLPTSLVIKQQGKLSTWDFDYENVIPGKAWLLRECVHKAFRHSDAASWDVPSDGWQHMVHFVRVGEPEVDAKIPASEFKVEFPDGTVVSNALQDPAKGALTFTVGAGRTQRRSWLLTAFVVFNLIFVPGVLLWVWFRSKGRLSQREVRQ